jgi:UDP-glucose 4-epimerase
MRILVTGGCGFIGSHVVDAYVRKGHDIAIVDNLSTGTEANKNEKARLYKVDIRDASLEEVFRQEKPDIVNHHAAQISVPLSVKDPLTDAEINVKGTLQLLDLSQRYDIKKFIFASTGGAIYGEADQVPTSEDYHPIPASPYAIAKLSAENYIRFFGQHHGLHYTILRYANVYGPRQIPHGEAGVVALFTEALLQEKLPTLNRFANQPMGMIRDYCYVKDVAEANMAATAKDLLGMYNIATGVGTCTLDLYRLTLRVLREMGVKLGAEYDEPKRAEARDGDILVSTLNPDKARRELAFQARHALEEGLSETVRWYLEKQRQDHS